MATSSVSRSDVLDVVRRAADALRAGQTGASDAGAVSRALATACDNVGISPQAFDAAVAGDPELEHLKSEALREALAGGTDPGPHAAISRESMSGQPGDTTKSRTHSEPERRH